jgi:hypothetical protein
MNQAIESYLEQLRRSLEAHDVDHQKEALDDAREYLEAEYEECKRSRPDLDESHAMELVCRRFGDVETVANAYDRAEGSTRAKTYHRWSRRFSYAPGWKVTCSGCGRSADLASVAPFTVRWMAWSRFKVRLGWCTECRRLVWLRHWKS